MTDNESQQELEPGVVFLGTVFATVLIVTIYWLAT